MRLWLILPAALLALLLVSLPALAHASVVRTDPPDLCHPAGLPDSGEIANCNGGIILAAPPAAVTIWFSEPVAPFGTGISVFAPSGKRVERGPVELAGSGQQLRIPIEASEEGTYLVRWQIIAGDTHPSRGSYIFSVVHASTPAAGSAANELGAVSPVGLAFQVAAHWLHFLGYTLSFGVLSYRFLIARRGSSNAQHIPPMPLNRLVYAGIALLLLAEPGALLGQTGSFGPDLLFDPAAVGDTLDSSFGRVLSYRLAAAVLLWVLLGMAQNGTRYIPAMILGLGVVLAGIDSTVSHAITVQPIWLGIALNSLHLIAAAVWTGGLLALLTRWLQTPILQRANLLTGFTPVAATALGVLVITGTLNAIFHLAMPANLLATAYGLTLTAKLGLMLLALLAVAVARRQAQHNPRPWLSFEAAALLAVLALAGLLIALPAPS